MAQSIGSKIQAILVGILIALLVLAFAVWGINDVFSPSGKNAAMSLGKHEVTSQEFELEFRRELASLAQTEGRQLPHQEAFDRGIHRQVLQRLLTSKVIEVDADELGIGVNSRSALDYVAEIEVFRDELTGKFSEQKLNEILAQQRPPISRAAFEQNLINDLRQRQTIPAINGGVVAPLKFAQQRYQYLTEQRRAQVLTLTDQAISAPPEPTDEDLQTYMDENPIQFTAPEYRRISLIRLEARDMLPDLEITKAELDDLFKYKIELGEVGSPETRSLAQITASDEATALKAVGRLNAGDNPYTVASLLNLIEPITYENVQPEAILDPETAKAAFEFENGEAKAILGSLGNWYAVVVNSVTPAVTPDFDSIKSELEAELLQSKAEEKLFDITPKIEDALDEGASLEEAAEAAGVPYASIDFFDRSGTTIDGLRLAGFQGLEGIADDETILTETFINDMGYPTDLFETSTGGWAVLRIDDIRESQRRPFEDVRDAAKTAWTTQKINEALDDIARDLAARAQDGESLIDIATSIDNGARVDTVILVRSNPGNRLGPQVAAGLLDSAVGDIERGPGPQPLTRQVAKLTDIIANQDSLAGQYADILQDQATAAIRSDLNQAYQAAVLSEHPVNEYPDTIKSILGLDTAEE